MVYLIHFDEPFKHARHYLGYAKNLEKRLEHHRRGTGARLMRAIGPAQISWSVVRTWEGDGNLEQKLKRQHRRHLCPVCRGETAT